MRWQDAVRSHLVWESPREACGLLVDVAGTSVYRRCRNTAAEEGQFVLDPEDWADAEDAGAIQMIIHTHPTGSARPSMADLVGCEKLGLPWGIMDGNGHFEVIYPKGYEAPLIGRPFVYGVLDCWAVVRDYYRTRLGVEIADGPRQGYWWKRGENRLVEHLSEHGFSPAESPTLHDLLLFQVGAEHPNHVAVCTGSGRMLHHPADGLSCEVAFRHEWQRTYRGCMRYAR